MRTHFTLIAFFLLFSTSLLAQDKLQVMGAGASLYLSHTVKPGENWYSVGRIYNISPKEIAPFNRTTMDKPLAIGQSLQIPLTDINFSQNGTKASDEVFVPLYHKVADKEWMYRISTQHNKVPVENLEKWNNIKNDQLRSGMLVIVGYLKVKPGQSALAAKGTSKVPVVTGTPEIAKKTENPAPVKEEPVKPTTPVVAKKEVVPPPVKETEVKEEPKTPEPKATETKTTEPGPVTTTGTSVNHKGGSFRKQFGDGATAISGNAGIFRSTSGWSDGKYYALMNNVPVGTIVKVNFSSTNKTIYAKVLGQLPEMKESTGLTLRISDAAASELGVENTKFFVEVKY